MGCVAGRTPEKWFLARLRLYQILLACVKGQGHGCSCPSSPGWGQGERLSMTGDKGDVFLPLPVVRAADLCATPTPRRA